MSTHHQFLHFGLYGVKPRTGQPEWASISGITREGARAPGAARHVPYPATPTLLHGISPIEAGRIAIERAVRARDAIGRRLRCDGMVLVAAVASYPEPRAVVEDRDAPDAADLYHVWRDAALAWGLGHFGDTLLSVVEHADEEFLHLHFYAVPALGPGDRLMLEAIHPGRAALREAEAESEGKAAQRAAYVTAMQALQDAFHAAVSVGFGHARLGPRRRRLQRTEHLVRRDAQRQHMELERAYDHARSQLRGEVEVETRAAFANALAEARRRADALAQARAADRSHIADLIAENAALVEALRALQDDLGGGYGR